MSRSIIDNENEEHSDFEAKKFSFSGLLRLFCCPPLPTSIGNKLAFLKIPPTYYVVRNSDNNGYSFHLKPSSGWELSHRDRKYTIFNYIHSPSGNKLSSLYLKIYDTPVYTILFSHGNAVDIGNSCGYLIELAIRLKVNIFCYDYSGYGLSEGVATEKNVCLDIRAACLFLQSRYNIHPRNIILYGQSIGTVPTIDLATEKYFAGVILHSSLASGLRVVFPNLARNLWCDVFKSSSKISKVLSPTLIIHGRKDDIVNFSHGTLLYDLATNPVKPLWIDEAGHNDIEFFPDYYIRLKEFIYDDLPGFAARLENLSTEQSQSKLT